MAKGAVHGLKPLAGVGCIGHAGRPALGTGVIWEVQQGTGKDNSKLHLAQWMCLP